MKTDIYNNEPIYALSTPEGKGAISLIRISGNKIIELVKLLFKNPEKIYYKIKHQKALPITLLFNNKIIDHVILIYYKSPNSYTGEDLIEISCHGNPLIVENIKSALFQIGIREAKPGEFTQRAVLNDKINLFQAEAIGDLINAESDILLDKAFLNLKNRFSSEIKKISDDIRFILGEIEVRIDFPEEELSNLDLNEIINRLTNIGKQIRIIIENSEYLLNLNKGYRILIVGKTNVGKSSLFNKLLNQERAIVSTKKGTTRDYIEANIKYNGISIILTDTAGINAFSEDIELIGKEKMKNLLNMTDYIFWVLDNSEIFNEEDKESYDIIKDYNHAIIINKIDLENRLNIPNHITAQNQPTIDISVQNNHKIDSVMNLIKNQIDKTQKSISENTTATNQRQLSIIKNVNVRIKTILNDISNNENILEEILAEELWNITNLLSELNLSIDVDSLWDDIFSTFCLGK